MSLAVTVPPLPAKSPVMQALACPNCGIGLSHTGFEEEENTQDAQRRIAELESQVRILTGKATAAVDKLADYEDELRRLKAHQQRQGSGDAAKSAASLSPEANHGHPRCLTPPGTNGQQQQQQQQQLPPPPQSPGAQTRNYLLSSFLSTRKSHSNIQGTAAAQAGSVGRTSPSTTDLQAALSREQTLRQQAEGRLSQANGELEELSAQLFQQANEMVAAERKARAKLEERVEVLERRDGEKRKRLERLETAVKRIERVRGLLAPGR